MATSSGSCLKYSAAIRGFSETKSGIIGVMDADMSHPAEAIPRLLEPILKGEAELAIGSRYAKGGGVEVWPLHRRIISRMATLMATPLTSVKDPMSGLFFMKRSVIEGIALNAKGYKIGLEVLVKGKYGKVVEIPYVFRNRFVGRSKLTASEYIHYLRNLIVLAAYKLFHGTTRKHYEARSPAQYYETYKNMDPRLYYDALLKGNRVQQFWHEEKFREVLREASGMSPESIVADIGCASGVLISKLPKTKLAVAVDVAEPIVRFATELNKKLGRNVKGVVALAEKLPFKDNTFDYVFMIEVIEHMPPELEPKALAEAKRVLKPGGKLVMTTPNYRSMWPLVEYFWSRMNPIDYMEQHINRKNPTTVRKALAEAGFKVTRVRTFFILSPFLAFISKALALKAMTIEKKMLARTGLLVIANAEKL